MARVKLAKNAGFCMGVRRAMNRVLEEALKKEGSIYTLGPLIHNPQILEILQGMGITIISAPEVEPCLLPGTGKTGTIVIRAHGVSPQVWQKVKDSGFRVLNATCPHVGKVHAIIKRWAKEGYATVIVGDPDHAEVIGLLGYAQGRGYVINSVEEIEYLPPLSKVCLVAQTTQDHNQFQAIAGAFTRKFPEAKVFDTICSSTLKRQDEVLALARRVEAMVVVGGRDSANTGRLAKISEEAGIPTLRVETAKDLDLRRLSQYSVIGVTAGASTPNWVILQVVERLKGLSTPQGVVHFLEKMGRLATISYLFLALGAGGLTYASALIQGHRPRLSWLLIASFYVFSMHVLNRLTDKDSEKYNQPGRTEFLERYGNIMFAAGIFSAILALVLAWFQGIAPFFLLLAISGLGALYNIRLVPNRTSQRLAYLKLKDIPGSKTIFVALAWGIVTSLLPSLAEGGILSPETAVAFIFSFILVFIRSTIYDFKDIQGDLMVGKETIPIVLGEKRTEILVGGLLIFLGGLLVAAGVMKWAAPLSPFLLVSLGYIVLYYYLYRLRISGRGFAFEAVVDGSFIFTGLWAFILSHL